MKKAVALFVVAAVAYAGTHHGGTASTIGASAPVAGGSNEAIANSMAASGYGYRAAGDMPGRAVDRGIGVQCLRRQPTSDARGIPQNINGWSADYQEGGMLASKSAGGFFTSETGTEPPVLRGPSKDRIRRTGIRGASK